MALRHHRGLWQRSCAALALLGLISGQILNAQAKAQTPASANILAEAAKAIGVKKCQNALSRLGAVTTYGSQKQEVLMDWNRQNPDTNPVFSLLGGRLSEWRHCRIGGCGARCLRLRLFGFGRAHLCGAIYLREHCQNGAGELSRDHAFAEV